MKYRNGRRIVAILITVIVFAQAVMSNGQTSQGQQTAAPSDWSKAVVESTMSRYGTPESLRGWGYAKSLYLYGQYLVYKRTKDKKYLDHIKGWIDLHIDEKGTINRSINALDYMLPGNLLLILYQETKEEKYKLAAANIRKVFDTYPRTKEGGLWHADVPSRKWQLWADGVFMSLPFLMRYGKLFGDSAYANDEATKQLLIYYKNLYNPQVGLLHHAYDESGVSKWADPTTKRSSFFWCRAIGWYAMTLIEVLEILPEKHPKRSELISILRQLVQSFAKYQDKKTGLWYQIVDKGDMSENWLETSSSSMYTYATWMAVKRGYVDKKYKDVALKGYKGVLTKISVGSDGLTNLVEICEGTNVGDLAYYFARKRHSNDFHGLGAFLIMNEQLMKSAGGNAAQSSKEKKRG